MCLHTQMRFLQRPEEDIRFPGAEVSGSYEMLNVGAGE